MTDASPTSFKDLFSSGAREYAQYRPRYPIELADVLAAIAPSRAVAWDCGCGSGQLSTVLGERFERVIATDASKEQVAKATPHPRVEYRVGAAESSGIEAGIVDLAVAAQAAHWFDLPAYYAEVRRVATHGAAIALVSYNLARITPEIDAVVDDFYWNVLGGYWPLERRHVDAAYRTLDFPFEELEVPHLEMYARWSFPDLMGYVQTWSAVQALVKAEGPGRLDAFVDRLRVVWGAEKGVREGRLPLAIRAGRVEMTERTRV